MRGGKAVNAKKYLAVWAVGIFFLVVVVVVSEGIQFSAGFRRQSTVYKSNLDSGYPNPNLVYPTNHRKSIL
jgi:hypothetical protein